MSKFSFLDVIHIAGREAGCHFESIKGRTVYKVTKENKSFMMFNMDLGLNNSSSIQLAKNKDLTYEVLKYNNIDAILHYFVLHPNSPFQKEDSFEIAKTFFNIYENNIVIKPSNGLQGQDCYNITSTNDLIDKLNILFSKQNNICLSPFMDSELEFRVVVLNGKVKLSFAKRRTNSWKHNLTGGGAIVEEVEGDIKYLLHTTAETVANAMDLKFCSIDFFYVKNKLYVLEVNNSVFLGSYCQSSEERYNKSIDLFKEAFNYKFLIQ